MIPVFIIARDRFTSLRNMTESLDKIPEAKVVIVDNASTYPPLLNWYKTCPYEVFRLRTNIGRTSVNLYIDDYDSDYYVISDPDMDLEGVPVDMLDFLRNGLENHPDVCKTGLGIRIDDIPEKFPFREKVIKHESRFWMNRRDDQWWNGGIDSTFAMYRRGVECPYDPALRGNYPYVCRHTSWYLDFDNLPDDERYYLTYLKGSLSTWSGNERCCAGIFRRGRPPEVIEA